MRRTTDPHERRRELWALDYAAAEDGDDAELTASLKKIGQEHGWLDPAGSHSDLNDEIRGQGLAQSEGERRLRQSVGGDA